MNNIIKLCTLLAIFNVSSAAVDNYGDVLLTFTPIITSDTPAPCEITANPLSITAQSKTSYEFGNVATTGGELIYTSCYFNGPERLMEGESLRVKIKNAAADGTLTVTDYVPNDSALSTTDDSMTNNDLVFKVFLTDQACSEYATPLVDGVLITRDTPTIAYSVCAVDQTNNLSDLAPGQQTIYTIDLALDVFPSP